MQRLIRVFYRTDADEEDAGTVSEAFSTEEFDRRVVGVDWSVRGRVEVTFLVETTSR